MLLKSKQIKSKVWFGKVKLTIASTPLMHILFSVKKKWQHLTKKRKIKCISYQLTSFHETITFNEKFIVVPKTLKTSH